MEKAKTSWQAQDLIVDDNPSRSLCKPPFFIPMKSVDGWFYAAEPMHSGFHWEAGAASIAVPAALAPNAHVVEGKSPPLDGNSVSGLLGKMHLFLHAAGRMSGSGTHNWTRGPGLIIDGVNDP